MRKSAKASEKLPQSVSSNGAKLADAANLTPEAIEKLGSSKITRSAPVDPLLSEHIVSNKEQRKADWAIMKEMTRYLWPKVRLASGSLMVS